MASEESKLGRNPLFKKRKSPVKKMLEGVDQTLEEEPVDDQPLPQRALDLYQRIKLMDIEVDWSQVFGRAYARLRRK